MQVTVQENEKYRTFVNSIAIELGVFNFGSDDLVWHYTNGQGLLGILQTSTLYATQVSCLNDPTETRYATDLYRQVLAELRDERKHDPQAKTFFDAVLDFLREEPESPTSGASKFFVTCFSGDDDELTQWDRYSKPNGYAIAFYPNGLFREPTSRLYRVTYDRVKHLEATRKLALATLNFYLEGLINERLDEPDIWGRTFFAAWDEWMYKLAPLAKDHKWRSENEYRLVHELKPSEFPEVQFRQTSRMLSRYIGLATPSWVKRRAGLLPIAKIKIGPGNHNSFTKISVLLLLEQMGYLGVPVETTDCSIVW